MSSNYISAAVDYDTQQIMVWERGGDERTLSRYPCPYYFYIEDENGEFESLYGKKLTRLDFETQDEFERGASQHRTRYESDISPLDKVLMENYYGREAPKLRYAFLDIEVDYKQELGFSSPENPYAPINAITIYFEWLDSYITVAVPPPEWHGNTEEEFSKIMPEIETNLIIVPNEYELLLTTLDLIRDCDLLSGWNSDFYDMPYLVKRTEMVLGRQTSQKWCFPGARYPKFKEVEKFGVKNVTVKLTGRIHLDYLQLFKKFTFEGRTSFALAAIADEELDIPKLEYDGTLEELYHNNFIMFLKYNIRDTQILHKLDNKFNFIALANQMAHDNTVLLDSVLGTVKLVETGIANYAHNVMKRIVADKEMRPSHGKVEGAIVMTPQIGLHEWVGSVDLTSLYPSCIRALNISPEKIIGQFTDFEDDWRGIWNDDDKNHILALENNEHFEAIGKEWKDILKQKKWAVSAYGTVFDQSSGQGVVAAVLTAWFAERKKLQAEKKKWSDTLIHIKLNKYKIDNIETGFARTNDDSEKDFAKNVNEAKEKYKNELKNGTYEITDIFIFDCAYKKDKNYIHAKEMVAKYDLLQNTKKIQLNSTYGALLNQWFRWFDERMGASVTATGRQITTHMIKTAGKHITGQDYELVKTTEVGDDGKVTHAYTSDCPAIIYGDTDSCYFKTMASNKEDAIKTADKTAEVINNSFQPFMQEAFLCNDEYDNLIKAAREIVGMRGLFQAKKKYIIKVIDLEGMPADKLKAMGSEIKKSDTPKVIQKFLKNVLNRVLEGEPYEKLEEYVNGSRRELFKGNKNLINLGIAKAVNKIDMLYDEWKRIEKTGKRRLNLPGHVRASINYNEYVQKVEGPAAKLIKSGDKVLIFYLKPNQEGFTNIAIPSEMTKLPKWFSSFGVDIEATETKMIDAKLEGIFRSWGYDVPTVQGSLLNKLLVF